jgi:hypothetical protein
MRSCMCKIFGSGKSSYMVRDTRFWLNVYYYSTYLIQNMNRTTPRLVTMYTRMIFASSFFRLFTAPIVVLLLLQGVFRSTDHRRLERSARSSTFSLLFHYTPSHSFNAPLTTPLFLQSSSFERPVPSFVSRQLPRFPGVSTVYSISLFSPKMTPYWSISPASVPRSFLPGPLPPF